MEKLKINQLTKNKMDLHNQKPKIFHSPLVSGHDDVINVQWAYQIREHSMGIDGYESNAK